MKKLATLLSLILLVTVLLAGCGGNNETENSSGGQNQEDPPGSGGKITTITYWNGYTGPDRPALEAVVKKFNDTNDHIEVKMDIMPWDVMFQKLTAAAATGSGPDIVTFGVENIKKYLDMGIIEPIEDFESIVDPSVLPEAFLPFMKDGDKYIAFPMGFFSNALYYNKDMFADAGLDPEKPPATWEELAEYAVNLTKKNGKEVTRYGINMNTKDSVPNWQILMWGYGGDVVNEETMEVRINSKESVEAVRKFADLVLNQSISPTVSTGLDAAQMFTAGKSAMMISGPWEVTGVKKAGINYGVAQVPGGPVNDVTYGGGTYTVMTKTGASKREAIAEYLKYWISPETQVEWSLGSGYPPARTDMLDNPAFDNAPEVKQFAKGLERAKFYNVSFVGADRIDREALYPAFEQILLKKVDVQKAFDDAAKMIESILEEE